MVLDLSCGSAYAFSPPCSPGVPGLFPPPTFCHCRLCHTHWTHYRVHYVVASCPAPTGWSVSCVVWFRISRYAGWCRFPAGRVHPHTTPTVDVGLYGGLLASASVTLIGWYVAAWLNLVWFLYGLHTLPFGCVGSRVVPARCYLRTPPHHHLPMPWTGLVVVADAHSAHRVSTAWLRFGALRRLFFRTGLWPRACARWFLFYYLLPLVVPLPLVFFLRTLLSAVLFTTCHHYGCWFLFHFQVAFLRPGYKHHRTLRARVAISVRGRYGAVDVIYD
jgi:hypothetical protein